MVTIELGNIGCEKQAKKLVEKLSGKTFYNFKVGYGIDCNNYPVYVSTDYEDADEDEVKDMLMFVMACDL